MASCCSFCERLMEGCAGCFIWPRIMLRAGVVLAKERLAGGVHWRVVVEEEMVVMLRRGT
jgi:hypothetical protein